MEQAQLAQNFQKSADVEIEAIVSCYESLDQLHFTPFSVDVCIAPLQNVLADISRASSNEKRGIILYFHNSIDHFSSTFWTEMNIAENAKTVNQHFHVIAWNVELTNCHSALENALFSSESLSVTVDILREKKAAAILILAIENAATVFTVLRGSHTGSDIMNAVHSAVIFINEETSINSNTGTDMEIEAITSCLESFNNRMNMEPMRVNICKKRLEDVLNEMCSAPLNMRRGLILFFHNSTDKFSTTFWKALNSPEQAEFVNTHFYVITWNVEVIHFHNTLLKTLNATGVLDTIKAILQNKESAAFLILPIGNSINLFTVIRGSKPKENDILETINKAHSFLREECEDESQLAQITKGRSNSMDSRKYQTLMAEPFIDCDYCSFEHDEKQYLKDKVGYAFYGQPISENGYDKKQLKEINGIVKQILDESNKINGSQDYVELAIIFNCTEFLPQDKVKLAKNNPGYNPLPDFTHYPIFVLRKCRNSPNPCRVFIDHTGRVYKTWVDYINRNKLPKCQMILPRDGRYQLDEAGKVMLEMHLSPACHIDKKLLIAADITTAVGGILSGGIFFAAAIPAIPVAPIVLTGGIILGVGAGIYSVVRSGYVVYDRVRHKQSMHVKNSEARGAYINIVAGGFGFFGAGATAAVSQLVSRGVNISKGVSGVFTTINFLNLGVSGVGIINSGYDVFDDWYNNNQGPSTLTIIQLSSSLLFFGHAVYNFKGCATIVEETQAKLLREYQDSLRSNRHRKTFNKLMKETIRNNDGDVVKGRAEVIKAVRNIADKNEVFASLTRNNKELNRQNIRFSAEGGEIVLNGKRIEMSTFTQLSKQDSINFLNNLSSASNVDFEPLPQVQPSKGFIDACKKIVNETNPAECMQMIVEVNSLFRSSTEEMKLKVFQFLTDVALKLSEPLVAAAENILPMSTFTSYLLRFLVKKISELFDDYVKFKETADEKYYNRLFDYVDMEKVIKWGKGVIYVLNAILDPRKFISHMVHYCTSALAEIVDSYRGYKLKQDDRPPHLKIREEKQCECCGGKYWS